MSENEQPLYRIAGDAVLAVMATVADSVLAELRQQYEAEIAAARGDPAVEKAIRAQLAAAGRRRVRAVLDDMVAHIQSNWPRVAATLAADTTTPPT